MCKYLTQARPTLLIDILVKFRNHVEELFLKL